MVDKATEGSERLADTICLAIGLAFGVLCVLGIVGVVQVGIWTSSQGWPYGWAVLIFLGIFTFTLGVGTFISLGLAFEGLSGLIKNRRARRL